MNLGGGEGTVIDHLENRPPDEEKIAEPTSLLQALTPIETFFAAQPTIAANEEKDEPEETKQPISVKEKSE